MLKHILILSPLLLFFSLYAGHYGADWDFYYGDCQLSDYPPLLCALIQNLPLTKELSQFILGSLIFVIAPYFLYLKLTGWRGALFYAYLSAIPLAMFLNGWLAQGVVHLIILGFLIHPIFAVFFLLGPLVHQFAIPAFIFAAIFEIMRKPHEFYKIYNQC